MLTAYITTAMQRAIYEFLEDDGTKDGSIPELPGVWANTETHAACQQELQAVLEDWILLGLHLHHPIPPLDGVDLNPPVNLEVA
ncbi:MAG: type II toxin-antitoxin system HicB family antitoxin [Acaryochloridaceae cyanobacterium CSU_3_4]|nr:type II toxin-antitoxin system HicB family antitoxin [Acaryochloridaceae cyanobacterium CSU_3_4]